MLQLRDIIHPLVKTASDLLDQIAAAAPLAAKLVRNATLKIYPGLPHGLCTTHPEIVNPDLLAFVKA